MSAVRPPTAAAKVEVLSTLALMGVIRELEPCLEQMVGASSPSDLRRQRMGLPVLVWRMEPRFGGCPRTLTGSALRLAP